MMKKILFILCFAVLTLLLSGCGNPEAKKVNTNAQQSVADVLQQGMAAADKGNNNVRETNASVPEPTPAQVTPAPHRKSRSKVFQPKRPTLRKELMWI